MKKTSITLLLIVCCLPVFAQTTGTNSILLQAEDFTSYTDTSEGNYNLVYRQDVDVDMNYDHDPYWYEGIRVMAIQTGEELTYTFDVPVSDVWDITFNGIINFDLYFDGIVYEENIGTPLDFRGDFRYNQDIVVPGVSLSAGAHTMTIISNSYNDFGDVQLDYIWFASTTNPPDPPSVAEKPYDDTAPPPVPADYVSPVSQYGKLYVDGPDIKSEVTGENASLRFVAVSGATWFPTIKNNTIYNLAYHEGVQGIRLAMYGEYGTYDDPYVRPYVRQKTLEVIEECIDAGIYLEISYHTHATDFEIGGDAYDVEMDFYNWLLSEPVVTGAPPNLILGIVNEIASTSIPWSTAKPYAQEFVNLIRQSLPENLILCGTPFWCQHPQDVIGDELAGSNIVYTFHMYTAEHEMSIADNIITCYDAGLPLWANEISPGHYDWQTWSYNFVNFTQLILMLESRGIPWTNWAWTIKGEALSALYWSSQYYGPWKDSELTEGGEFIRNLINNYLISCDFSDGPGAWYLNDWEEPAADVEFINEEAHIFYNDVASEHFYGQQFSLENIPVIQGITYTVEFSARAAAPRTIVVDVTENGDDYTTYGSSGDINILTDMNSYVFSFTMTEPADENARIVFNVGASLDDIWFDSITIAYSELYVPPEEKDDVIILNESFHEDSDWTFNPWQPSFPSAEIDYTGNEAHITFLELAQDPWGQQLSKGITLEQGASYVVQFNARSTAKRPLQVNIGNSETYESYGAKDFVLSTHMVPYSFHFTLTSEASENDIIQFNLGTDIKDIWIDNVSIIKYNRLLNGDFSMGEMGWTLNPWEPSWPSAEIDYTGNEAHVSFLALADHDYGQQLFTSLKLTTGESYIVRFNARSTAPRPLKALITNDSYYYASDFILSETMEQYSFEFIMDAEASDNDSIRFDMGTDTSDIWLDNVVVQQQDNLLRNGHMSMVIEPWTTGFYESSEGSGTVQNGELVMDIVNSGTENWHIQVLQSNVALDQGKRYYMEFDARAEIAREIEVNIGSGDFSNPEPYTTYSGSHFFMLDTGMQTYSFEFTMNQPDHHDARCEFNLGLDDSNVILDNVRIYEIIEISDDFNNENDPGNWQINGEDCFWIDISCADVSLAGMVIMADDGNLELTNSINACDADFIQIDFSYITLGYFFLFNSNWEFQFSPGNGDTWITIYSWIDEKIRYTQVDKSIQLNSEDFVFTDNCRFRFKSSGKFWWDITFIDSVVISLYK